jgi:hypothetical protein
MQDELEDMQSDEVESSRDVSATKRRLGPAMTCLVALSLPMMSGLGDAAPGRTFPHADEDGFVAIFNGRDLVGWTGQAGHWTVEDGAISGSNTAERPLKHNSFLIWEGGKPANFELRFRYRIVGGNSGVQYRSRVVDPREYIVSGYQADIDSSPRFTGMNYEEGGRTFLAQRGERVSIDKAGRKATEAIGDRDELQKKIRSEGWNEYIIIAEGHRLRHFVNGTLLSEVTDDEERKAASSGVLAIQLHSGPPMKVQLKDIRLRELK